MSYALASSKSNSLGSRGENASLDKKFGALYHHPKMVNRLQKILNWKTPIRKTWGKKKKPVKEGCFQTADDAGAETTTATGNFTQFISLFRKESKNVAGRSQPNGPQKKALTQAVSFVVEELRKASKQISYLQGKSHR